MASPPHLRNLRRASTVRRPVEQVEIGEDGIVRRTRADALATEEPLEIRVVRARDVRGGRVTDGAATRVAVTMRTPGADFELAAGFLFAEGIVRAATDVAAIRYCTEGEQHFNVVNVVLSPSAEWEPSSLAERAFPVTSACGVCGKASIEDALGPACPRIESDLIVTPELLLGLPDVLRDSQAVFERTGGLHAAALFTAEGALVRLREDVGRHNALDKLVGAALLAGELPLSRGVVLVSGRTSFELAQKAARAGVPVLAGVSAPSSLAVDLAESVGMTLAGFLRGSRFNVYSAGARIAASLHATTGQGG
jgi:FdhD protein